MLDVKTKDAQLSTREYANKMKLFMKQQFALLISDGQTEVRGIPQIRKPWPGDRGLLLTVSSPRPQQALSGNLTLRRCTAPRPALMV